MARFSYEKFIETTLPKISPSKQASFRKSIRYFEEWNTELYLSGDATVDKHWLAYILATGWHETGFKFMPVEEGGKGRGYKYGIPNKRGLVYYGRGDVQITWEDNYEKFAKLLNVDLVNNPALALDETVSIKIAFKGMYYGMFTGKCLRDYMNVNDIDPINARRIVNGVRKGELLPDKAEQISKYYLLFLEGLQEI